MASAAAIKASRVVGILLWCSLLLFFVHGWSNFGSSRTHSASPALIGNRKSLRLMAQVDLGSFQIRHRNYRQHEHHHHHHHQHRHHGQHSSSSPVVVAEPGGDPHEIDPRYGVEKRLVPTGPNPLHH
ncbi:hypothetical protein H6P81_009519 [Aristolochia fimbriata]|uniref:Uncharacterized protein n=1 Tax=Aristolochia fimbriata TaxID=158543 RepID=A0AAV7ELN5_ARIFI|nr:hypothetical protein H6P81_009519 [Aristolochia fimbriata]